MTQMLLFETPAPSAAAETTAIAITAGSPQDTGEENLAEQLQHDSGLHHMGDLARLVLLRYDLVAKRRALMAARKAGKRS